MVPVRKRLVEHGGGFPSYGPLVSAYGPLVSAYGPLVPAYGPLVSAYGALVPGSTAVLSVRALERLLGGNAGRWNDCSARGGQT